MAFNLMTRVNNARKAMFGSYHATQDRKRRSAPRVTVSSEDRVLGTADRRKLIATAREQRRNQTILAWLIRTHLDSVSRFSFQAQTGDKGLDLELERLMAWRSRAGNWDVAGRHNRNSYMRLVEAGRVVDGDIGNVLVRGGLLQAIEGDRIAWPTKGGPVPGKTKADWTNGVRLSNAGKSLSYMVNKRDGESLVYDRVVSARNFDLIGYYDRFDQVRGISPLASALTMIQDNYEVHEALRIKAKMQAILGIFFKRAASTEGDGYVYTDQETGEDPDADTERYTFDMVPGLKIEGLPGDEADLLESRTPSTEVIEFSRLIIHIAMLALDIPMTFFDSRESSYSAQRQDAVRYSKAVAAKQEALTNFLDRITAWDLARWTSDGGAGALVTLPGKMLPRDVRWQWVPDGTPWIDPLKEVNANMLAVSAGFTTRDDVCRRVYNTRFTDVSELLGKEEAQAIKDGATLAIGQPGQVTTREEEVGNPANATTTGAE